MNRNFLKVSSVLIGALFITACSNMASTASVKGIATYRERMALTPNAQLEVILADVSIADAPYKMINKKIITPAGQVPLPFEISYDPKQIVPNHQYAVMARITDQDQLLFINDQVYQVITNHSPSEVKVLLKRVEN
jgi:putative lipoprotein